MECSLQGSSVQGILQARILEQVVMPSSRASSWPRDWTRISRISCIADGFFTHWATKGKETTKILWEFHSYLLPTKDSEWNYLSLVKAYTGSRLIPGHLIRGYREYEKE